MLGSLSIGARINAGFIIILLLIAGLAWFTVSAMDDVDHSFHNFSEAAEHTKMVDDTANSLAVARIAHLNYQIDHQDAARQRVENAITEVVDAAQRSATVFSDANEADIQRLFAGVGPTATRFRDAFAKQVATTEQGDALRDQFQQHGFELYTTLEQIMAMVRDSTDIDFGRSSEDSELLAATAELGLQFFRSRVRATIFMHTADAAELDGAVERIGQMNKAYDAMMRAAAHRPKARAMGETLRPMIDRFAAELDDMRDILGEQDRIARALQTEIGPQLTAALDETRAAIGRLEVEYGKRTTQQIDKTASFSMSIGIGALVLGLVLSVAIGRWIAGTVSRMAGAMSRMAEGQLDTEITGDGYRHELGAMARALKVFQTNARDKLRLDAEAKAAAERELAAAREREALQQAVAGAVEKAAAGDFATRVEARYRDEALNAFAGQLNALIEAVSLGVGETAKVMAALAEGNLTATMQGQFRGAFAELQRNVNTTVKRLSSTVIEIQEVSGTVSTATGEIAQGAQNLSGRAENQAASLEEIAATMEQMSATVKTNAENAYSASTLSAEASSRADKGGAIVAEAVTAMASIEEGSRKIADIVTVIDGFAFQTNLLALNAAVEAARAGEAGKGFAVVASEVRTLAQRSAEAARDIKTLIQESSHQVGDGVRLVEETGEALKEIVEAIRKVSETITEISEASREQSSGVDEITAAITSMDEITQQNSALADESASAAKGLTEQAARLTELMRFFRVDRHATGGASAWDADAAADRRSAERMSTYAAE